MSKNIDDIKASRLLIDVKRKREEAKTKRVKTRLVMFAAFGFYLLIPRLLQHSYARKGYTESARYLT